MSTVVQPTETIDWEDLRPTCHWESYEGCTKIARWIISSIGCSACGWKAGEKFCCDGHIEKDFFCIQCGAGYLPVNKRPL